MLTKLTSTESVGHFALALALTAPVVMFSNLQLRSILTTDARGDFRFRDYVFLRSLSTVLAIVVIVLIAALSQYRGNMLMVILAVGLSKAVESLSDLLYGLFQKQERMDYVAVSLMLRGIGALAVMTIAVLVSRNILWVAVAMGFWWACVLLGYDIRKASALLACKSLECVRLGDRLRHVIAEITKGSTGKVWQLATTAFPLGIVMLLISLNVNIPRYGIEQFSSASELGYFSALSYLVVAGNMLVSAAGQAASARLALHYQGELRLFWKLLLQLLLVSVLIGVGGIVTSLLWGRPILAILYRPEYGERTVLLVWLMAAGGVGYLGSILGFALTAMRVFQAQVPLYGIMTGITLLTVWLLVPRYGTEGAAMAMLISSLVQVGISLWLVIRQTHRQAVSW